MIKVAAGAIVTGLVLPFADWVHSVAGSAGDIVVIAAAGGIVVQLIRRAWGRTGKVALARIEVIETNTLQVPTIADSLHEHIRETTRRFDSGEARFEALEASVRELGHPPD